MKQQMIWTRRTWHSARGLLALSLCYTCAVLPVLSQEAQIAPVKPHASLIRRPYLPVTVPSARLGNSSRMADLMRAGKLYLTAQDAVRIALENNIDVEVARYNKLASEWQVERSEAGGALPGVPSGASQAASVASGQGVQGSQSAAGVSGGGGQAATRGTGNVTISQVGPVTQTLDPSITESNTFSHRTTPQPNITQSLTLALVSNTRAYTGSYQQGFLSGGSVSVSYTDHYLNENSPTDILNPSVAPNLSISAQQNLLRGFGIAVNARNITIAKLNVSTSDLNFKTQVIGVVVNVLDTYYTLVADTDDLRAKSSAYDAAQQFFNDAKKQYEFGVLTPLDVTNAETQVVAARQNLDLSRTSLQQQELQLKNLLSRTGLADQALQSVQIVPLDKIDIPERDELPPLSELIDRALKNRSDLAASAASITNAEISALGTKNGLLPTSQAFTTHSAAGLAGNPQPLRLYDRITGRFFIENPDPYFVGGIGNGLGQVFRRNFPSENVGAYLQASLGNNMAQADYGIDQLQLRQTQLTNQKNRNQAQVDVLNAVIALQQARAKYDAARRNRILNEQLLAAEQQKYTLGASTPYLVVQQQRDVVNAGSAETASLVAYSNARVALDQATGTTLETNHISIGEVRNGKLAAASVLPADRR